MQSLPTIAIANVTLSKSVQEKFEGLKAELTMSKNVF